MKYLNILDEQQRYVRTDVINGPNGQKDSHTCSYLYAREQLKSAGIVMGLEATGIDLILAMHEEKT